MSSSIGMFNTPRVIRLVVSTASVPDPHKYVLVGLAGAIHAGFFRLVMTLASADACFQPDADTYLNSCSIMSVLCTASLTVPDVKKSSYPLFGTQNVIFVAVGALLVGPDFFQGFFPFLAILNTLDLILIMLIEHLP